MQGNKDGFTLLEISIVVTIVALLIGGVLVGRDMIRAAELRNISTEAGTLKSAIEMFHQQYGALPGDFRMAYQFWPAAGCTDSNVVVDDAGCNGDGNGQIYPAAWYKEGLRGWQHLGLANMIQGDYTGTRASSAVAANRCVVGETIPRAEAVPAGWEYLDLLNHTSLGISRSGTAIALGFPDNLCMGAGVVTPEEAYSLDSKIDDGIPLRGLLMANHTIAAHRTGDCRDATGAAYTITNPARDCYLLWPLR